MDAWKLTAVACFLPALAACGSFVEVLKVDEMSMEAATSVQVLTREQLQGRKTEMVQTISATSCKNKMWDPEPTRENAIEQLRIKAARIGANTVTNLFCRAEATPNLGTNCWSAVVCDAAAVRTGP